MTRALSMVALTLFTLQLAGCDAVAEPPSAASTHPATTETNPVRSLNDIQLTSLIGESFDMAQLNGKAVLFVNVASKCGYTRQYEGLQKLYEAKKGDGLVIVGVPSNQFGGQEPGSAEEIQSFCKMNFGVSFPLLEKQDVNGGARSPLYRYLVDSTVGGGGNVGWNFEKFLVGKDGQVVGRFKSSVEPDSASLASAIDRALAG
jgi:glutathione peroxidase